MGKRGRGECRESVIEGKLGKKSNAAGGGGKCVYCSAKSSALLTTQHFRDLRGSPVPSPTVLLYQQKILLWTSPWNLAAFVRGFSIGSRHTAFHKVQMYFLSLLVSLANIIISKSERIETDALESSYAFFEKLLFIYSVVRLELLFISLFFCLAVIHLDPERFLTFFFLCYSGAFSVTYLSKNKPEIGCRVLSKRYSFI